MKKNIFKVGSIALLARGSVVLLGLTISVVAARVLDAENAGWFFLYLSYATFVSIVARFGLETAALKLISKAKAFEEKWVAGDIYLKIIKFLTIQSLIVCTLFSVILFFLPYELHFVQIITISGVSFFFSYQYFYSESLRGFGGLIVPAFFGGVLSSLLTVSFLFSYLLLSEQPLTFSALLLMMVVAGLLNVIFSQIYIKKGFCSEPNIEKSEYVMENVYDISPSLGVRSVLAFALSNADLWILSFYYEPAVLAVYGAVSRFLFIINFGLQVVNTVVAPKITKLHYSEDLIKMEKLIRTSASLAFIPTLLIVLLLLIFGDEMLILTFGSSYADGYEILVILLVGRLANALSGPCGYTLMMSGYHQYVTKSVLIVLCGTVLSGLILINFYGVLGLASAFAIGGVVQQSSLLLKVKKEMGFYPFLSFKYLVRAFK
jgi:O-antigen/teichoic acid export membrane protein